ncbi:heme-copper oxidase subunit III [Pontibacillus salicampi]|uniref:Heme-copper oxidase subunit III n=1 Tax=Pontibacillus salicampi TaxID=1449801 RepID=A0ABV6LS51_9BACI
MTAYESHHTIYGDKKLGFVLYLLGELVMFATLFATYIIFSRQGVNPTPSEVFEARTVIISSVFLLSSSGTIHLAEKAFKREETRKLWGWLIATIILAAAFLIMESHEFQVYYAEGFTLTTNVFLSSFYILVGLHAAHVVFGIGWMLLLAYQINRIPSSIYEQKQTIFGYYWHFVDIIWLFILAIVYIPYLL